MAQDVSLWNELLEAVSRPVRAMPGVERTLQEMLDAIETDAAPEETQARAREFLRANRHRLTIENLEELIAFGMCASNAVRAMVPHIGTVAASERGRMHDKQKGGDARAEMIERTKLWVLAEVDRRGLGKMVATKAARELGPEAVERSVVDGWRMVPSEPDRYTGVEPKHPYPTVLEWIRNHRKQAKK